MVAPLEMGWRHLLFENWPVDPELMDAHLPESLSADRHDGSAWLSVIPFTNVAVRPKGVPRPLGVRLPEINVRTYVTHDGVPSVYFFSLDAQGLASVTGARLFHHLPYYYARIALEMADGRVQFESQRRHPGARPGRYEATYWPTDEPFDAPTDHWRSSSLSAIAFTPKRPTAPFATPMSITTRGHYTQPPQPSKPIRCCGPMALHAQTKSPCTTTALG